MPYDVDPILLSYMGGIMDGEGSILITKSNRGRAESKSPSYTVRVSVSMCDSEIPKLFFNTFGGSFSKRDRTKDIMHKTSYEWILSSKKTIDFLESIIPYIRIVRKIETAGLCLEFQKHVSDLNIKGKILTKNELDYREKCYLRSKQLNHRGKENESVQN